MTPPKTRNDELRECPCGKVPTKLHIYGEDAKWKWVSGDCCNEWNIEFRTGYHKVGSKEIMERAIYAWNYAIRHQKQESEPVQELSDEDKEWMNAPMGPPEPSTPASGFDEKEVIKIIDNYLRCCGINPGLMSPYNTGFLAQSICAHFSKPNCECRRVSVEDIIAVLNRTTERKAVTDEENKGCFRWVAQTKRGYDLRDISQAIHSMIYGEKK